MEIWEPKSPGTLWATPGLLQDPLYLYLYIIPMFYFRKYKMLFRCLRKIVVHKIVVYKMVVYKIVVYKILYIKLFYIK